jgi:TPR repeat protein
MSVAATASLAAAKPEPAAAVAPTTPPISAAEIAVLVARGDALVGLGDLASARLFYARAAEAGDGGAALRIGATYDPAFLGRAGILGAPASQQQAISWYRRARNLGEAAAMQQLKSLHP